MPQVLIRPNLPDLAYVFHEGLEGQPIIMFLGGFRSDMEGAKALFLETHCREKGYGFIRFDYRGHGQSAGVFEESCISEWAQDAYDVLKYCTTSPVILIGSSMGGWISLLLACQYPKDVQAMIGLAAAPDFTTWMEDKITEDQAAQLQDQGYFELPNDYDDAPYIITKKLIDDGRENCLLTGTIDLKIPVRLIQGKRDADVPWQTAERIKDAISGNDVEIIYIEEADHRLSAPDQLDSLARTLDCLVTR